MNANTTFAHLATMSYDEARAAFTPEHNFLFDMEGQIYEIEALSSMLEPLLLDTVNQMRTYDRGRAAAIDYAACTLRQKIHDLAYAYDKLGARTEPAVDRRGDVLGRAA